MGGSKAVGQAAAVMVVVAVVEEGREGHVVQEAVTLVL